MAFGRGGALSINTSYAIIIFSALAGICGTGLGGVISVLLHKRSSDKMVCLILSFAAGVMTGIVCFELVPEALELADTKVTVLGLILGVLVIMLLNRAVDAITKTGGAPLHLTHEEFYHGEKLIRAKNGHAKLLRSGITMFIAIALHNIPEGLAIGAAGTHDYRMGVMLAMMITLHDIPEGMAIATPMTLGGMGKGKVVFITALSGAPTLLGGLIGVLLGGISNIVLALSLSVAGGAMLYVVFGEILPQSVVMTKTRTAPIVALMGILTGLVMTRFK